MAKGARTRRLLLVVGAGSLTASCLVACAPTSTSKVRDVANEVLMQLPSSSKKESAESWIANFEKHGFVGSGTGSLSAPTNPHGQWTEWGATSVAYAVAVVSSKVQLDVAVQASGTEAGIPGVDGSSYLCARVVLVPGIRADMTSATCPDDVKARASALRPPAGLVTLGEDLKAIAKK